MKKIKISLFLMICLLMAISCKKETPDTLVYFELDENFQLEMNQTGQLKNKDLTISPQSVIEDSRCPEGMMCIWEGRVLLKIKVNNVTHEIAWGGLIEEERYLTVDGYKIWLFSVDPPKQIDEDIKAEDYIFTFIVEEE